MRFATEIGAVAKYGQLDELEFGRETRAEYLTLMGRITMKFSWIIPCALVATASVSYAQDPERTLKIGVLSDMTGPYADLGGVGSVIAARLAVEDSGMTRRGWKIEILSADHQNKADIAANIAREWYDVGGVNAITDMANSAAALAVNEITRSKNKVLLASSAATSELTGKACSPNTVQWSTDTWAVAHGTGSATVRAGGKSWFFLTADYTFGHALETDTAGVVTATGGQVLGRVRVPLNTSDFGSYLLQAQASKAQVIGLANSGADTTNAIKQAAEFGIVAGGQKLAGLLLYITDIHALGLQVAQGTMLTSPFYWDMNDGTRTFAARFATQSKGAMPTMVQAGTYAAVLHYLKAVAAVGDSTDGLKLVNTMKAMPTDDPLFGTGTIRADGRKIHNMYLFEVKKPSESKKPWDYYTVRGTIPADEAFRPLAEGNCPLVKN